MQEKETKRNCAEMTDFEDIDDSPLDISTPDGHNESADAMWNFMSFRFRDNENEYELDSDDDDDLSKMSMSSTEKGAIAIPPNDRTVENSLSEELMKLSLNDRTAIEEEIHGVTSDKEETPEFLAWCLHKFDKELMNVKKSTRRRRKLERTKRVRTDNDSVPDSHAVHDNHDDEDVLRNVIRTTPDYVSLEGEESSTASASTSTSTMEIDTSTHFSRTPGATPINEITVVSNDESKRLCYVNDPDVRLRFLRAEQYDAKNAVKRFVSFLEFSQELYGSFVADRPIRLSDLKTREEKRALANVSFQLLPFRDRSGRRVYVSVGTCGYDIEPRLRCKVLWYMFWIASEDIESQRKGLIVVGWPTNGMRKSDDDEVKSNESDGGGSTSSEPYNMWEKSLREKIKNVEGVYQTKVLIGMPMRIAAVHCCFEDRPVYRILSALFYFALSPYLKSRYKVHIGEPLEIRYKLQGFGIPVDLLPLTHTLTLKRQNHLQWIAFRKLIEQNQGGNSADDCPGKGKKNLCKAFNIHPTDLVECPRSYDVIIGKAKYTNNPGNVFYRSLIEATHDEHISACKRDKVELTWRIVRQMEERNGRFLELNKSLKAWVHIRDRNVMRQKVAQSYKEFKRNVSVIRSKRNFQQHGSSKAPIKRQKVGLPTIFENDWFSCIPGMECNENNDFAVSKSIFTSM